MSKQTSIEWLAKQLINAEPNVLEWNKYLLQAKEMHKQEIQDAWEDGQDCEYEYHINNAPKYDKEMYYNETFNNKK